MAKRKAKRKTKKRSSKRRATTRRTTKRRVGKKRRVTKKRRSNLMPLDVIVQHAKRLKRNARAAKVYRAVLGCD